MTGDRGSPSDPSGGSQPGGGKGFRARKREDHAQMLIEELRLSLSDLSRAKRILRELGRFYDPILGGAIMDLRHQQEILSALEADRKDDALTLIETRYALYIKDRVHLGKRDES